MESDEVASGVATVLGVLTTIWGIWAIVVAFKGGTVPLLGWELDGSLNTGLLWMFIVVPAFEVVAYWCSMLVAIPLSVLFGKRGNR